MKNIVPFDPKHVEKELKPSMGDFGHGLITGGFSFIVPAPIGPIFAALFGTVISPPPMSRRLNKLLIGLAEDIHELQNRNQIEIEDLLNNESFLSTLIHAYQIAVRNHQKEKLEALQNAVLNSALINAPEDDLKILFLSYIDTFTSVHFKLLKFFKEKNKSKEWVNGLAEHFPHECFLPNGDSTSDDKNAKEMFFDMENVIKYEFPESSGFENLYLQVIKDLDSKDLIRIELPSTFQVIDYSRIDPSMQTLGNLFINFIVSPLDEE